MKPLAFIGPMMPTLVPTPPKGEGWTHEIKYDGYRTELLIDRDRSHAFTRNGHDWTRRYREIGRTRLVDVPELVDKLADLFDHFGDVLVVG